MDDRIRTAVAKAISDVMRGSLNIGWDHWDDASDGAAHYQKSICYRAADAVLSAIEQGGCAHEFDDWSNEQMTGPFNVCRHCGAVEGSQMRIGKTVDEFRQHMAQHRR